MSCTRSITCACIPMMMPSVTASHNWDEPSYLQNMSPPLEGSIESIFDQWADSDSFIVTHNGEKDWKKGQSLRVHPHHRRRSYRNSPAPTGSWTVGVTNDTSESFIDGSPRYHRTTPSAAWRSSSIALFTFAIHVASSPWSRRTPGRAQDGGRIDVPVCGVKCQGDWGRLF